MRLTGGSEATVVRGLRWKARGFTRAQCEARDRGLESCSVLTKKAVMPLHPAFSRLQNAEALVLVHRARGDRRLLPDHAFADDLGIHSLPNGVVDQPAAREKLRGHGANVLDADKVGEHVMALRWLRVIPEIDGAHRDTNPFSLTVEEASGGHTSS